MKFKNCFNFSATKSTAKAGIKADKLLLIKHFRGTSKVFINFLFCVRKILHGTPFLRRSKFFTFFTNLVSPPAELSSKFCYFALYFSQHFRTSCLTADTSTNRKFIYLRNTFVHSHFQKLLVRKQF